jgi:hypothetical protein
MSAMRIEIPSSLVNDQKRISVIDWVTSIVLEELGPNRSAAAVAWEYEPGTQAALVLTVTVSDTICFRMGFPVGNFGNQMDEFRHRFRAALHGAAETRNGW